MHPHTTPLGPLGKEIRLILFAHNKSPHCPPAHPRVSLTLTRVCFQVTSTTGRSFFPLCQHQEVHVLPAPAKAGMVLSTSSNNDSPVPKRWPLVRLNTGIVCIMLTTRKQKQSILRLHRDQEHTLTQELRSCVKQWEAHFMLFKLKPHSTNFMEQGP